MQEELDKLVEDKTITSKEADEIASSLLKLWFFYSSYDKLIENNFYKLYKAWDVLRQKCNFYKLTVLFNRDT